MSWSWSHTAEAYENARANLGRKSIKDLIVILAEWKSAEPDEDGGTGFGQQQYDDALAQIKSDVRAKRLSKEDLCDDIWNRMSEQATCTNGGWEAHCCPFGCGCHMVSFSTPEELRNEGLRKWREKKHER